MLFNSYVFIFCFLPIAFLGYFLLNRLQKYNAAKAFLVGMSLWFYSYFHANYLWIILFSIALNYFCHCFIVRKRYVRTALILGILGNIGLLTYYKYFNFLLENISRLFRTSFSLPEVLMPLGISFFTFQQIAFLIDSAKGKAARQKLLDYALFVTFFPQLIAGPIVSHEEMLPQFGDVGRKHIQPEKIYNGLRLFVLGLSKKVLLADTFGKAVDWGYQYYTVLDGWNTFAVMIFYGFQIYFDFSGYCDMARGIGYLFNIDIPVNFLSPYKSRNILEFWDRWHITLTRFFTRYVYIPLGGSRKGTLRTYVNVLLIFLISGIWHGAGWTYIVWGLLHGVLSVLTRVWRSIRKPSGGNRLTRGLSVCFMFLFVCCAWTFFRAETVAQAVYMLKKLMTFTGSGIFLELAICFQTSEIMYGLRLLHMDTLPYASYYEMIGFLLVAIVLTFCCKNLYEGEKIHRPTIPGTVILSALAVWCVISLSGVSTFLYFNF